MKEFDQQNHTPRYGKAENFECFSTNILFSWKRFIFAKSIHQDVGGQREKAENLRQSIGT